MKLKSLAFILTCAALGLMACAAQSANQAPPNEDTPEHIRVRFQQMDTNKDGKVVLEEFRAAFPNMNEQAFVMIDADGSKGIEEAEWYDFMNRHARDAMRTRQDSGMGMNNIPGDPLIPPPDSSDLPLMRPPSQ